MNKCLFCEKPLEKRKFCNSSCAVKYSYKNNEKYRGRSLMRSRLQTRERMLKRQINNIQQKIDLFYSQKYKYEARLRKLQKDMELRRNQINNLKKDLEIVEKEIYKKQRRCKYCGKWCWGRVCRKCQSKKAGLSQGGKTSLGRWRSQKDKI